MTDDHSGFLLTTTLLKPKSKGSIKFNDDGTMEIDPRYFHNNDDACTLKDGVKFILEKIKTNKHFQKLGALPYFPDYVGCVNRTENFDEYLQCAVRSTAISSYHLVGTNAVGRFGDKNSVLNPDLRLLLVFV